MTDFDAFVAWLAAHPAVTVVVVIALMNGPIKALSDRIGPL